MDVKGKKILIIGAGKTGKALTRVLYSLGAHIILMDEKKDVNVDELRDINITYSFGGYNKEVLSDCETVVLSPGVPKDIEILNIAKKRGIKITGEIEIACSLFPGRKIIAITGTDGKTTTTTLVYEIFKNAGVRSYIGGNIGVPAIEVLSRAEKNSYVILEISSFQLETTEKFRPYIAILLNIAEDHLDRHKTLEEYASCKAKIFLNQQEDDWTVLNYDSNITRALGEKTTANLIFFSQDTKLERGVFVEGGKIVSNVFGEKKEIISVSDIKIRGRHNVENSLAAISSALICNLDVECIVQTLKSFQGLPHRQEEVAEIDGIKFIDDSKATTPNSAIAAIRRFSEPIILIAGGRAKGFSFSSFAREISRSVKKLILIGESKEKIAEEVKKVGFYNFEFAQDLEEAVNIAYRSAKRGNVVLLSPACSSFDLFPGGYEERGNTFKKFVMRLKDGRKK